ncbi:hypothetical protein OIU76_007193 [Salix suchowensis]|uniref:glucan endo-1,3-beta-D-glucosidase n=1 Tax=Salix suchowensis TaxID=1278906 RepID=A0ABQ9BZV9_9ROSI|nr:hypothetical protein OIU76_007193 [Salix suchowensis]KAJ6391593.1 hypothetical protein OIU77_025548 [Salix suchowensis]
MDQSLPCKAIFLVATTLLVLLQIPFIIAVGINYGLNGDNLPAPPAVIDLYGRCNIPSIRLFEPRPEVLRALRGKPLQVILGTRNEDIKSLAATLDAANSWVADNIVPYRSDAIANMYAALAEAAITCIKVSTVIPGSSLSISYPPSAGTFTNEAAAAISRIASILLNHGASSCSTSLEKINQPGLTVVVTESGWPTAGNEPITSPENAQTYNRNLLNHVEEGRGTPRRPSQPLDVYFFAMFNEDLKQAGIEQHWGFFYPNMQPVYSFWQCP